MKQLSPLPLLIPTHGITEQKQAELNFLATAVINAGYKVDEQQTIVNALVAKLAEYQGFLTSAESNKETALNNLNLLKLVLSQTKALKKNSAIANDKTKAAMTKTSEMGVKLSMLIEQLIFTAEFINKLILVINKKKVVVPLISDELIKILTTAGTDANTAIAATLTALQSCYAADSSGKESLDMMDLEYSQCKNLVELLEGTQIGGESFKDVEIQRKQVAEVDKEIGAAISNVSRKTKSYDAEVKKLKDEQDKLAKTEQLIVQLKSKIHLQEKIELEEQKEIAEHELVLAEKELDDAENSLKEAEEKGEDTKKAQELIVKATRKRDKKARKLEDAVADLSAYLSHMEEVEKEITSAENNIKPLILAQAAALKTTSSARKALNKAYNDLAAKKNDLDLAFSELNDALIQIAKTGSGNKKTSLEYLLTHAYLLSVEKYKLELNATALVTKELEVAEAKLVVVNNDLNSLKAGLEAATAAALAA